MGDIYSDPYKTGLIDLMSYYMSLESERLDKALKYFFSVRFIVHALYKELVWRKELPPIDQINEDEKRKYWDLVKNLEGSKMYKITLCRCYYLINELRK